MQENSVFEIQDFTCATEYEEFIEELEKVVKKQDLSKCWKEVIHFGENSQFKLEYSIMEAIEKEQNKDYSVDMKHWVDTTFLPLNNEDDQEFVLHRMSGLSSILLLSEFHVEPDKTLVNSGSVKMIISAAAMALTNLNLRIPFFVNIPPSSLEVYTGIMVDGDVEYRFRTTTINSVPRPYQHLNGHIDLFFETFPITAAELMEIALRCSYRITSDLEAWPGVKRPITGISSCFPKLPHGSKLDPIDSLLFSCEFGFGSVQRFTKTSTRDSINPLNADSWTLSPSFLFDSGDDISEEEFSNELSLSQVFSRFASGWISELQEGRRRKKSLSFVEAFRSRGVSIVDATEIRDIVRLLFSPTFTQEEEVEEEVTEKTIKEVVSTLPTGSAAPYKSFLWIMCLHVIRVLTGYPGHEHMIPNANSLISVLWADVLKVLRWHWENLIPIPHLNNSDSPGIDLKWNLLHQKLTMLDYCISKLRERATTPILAAQPLTHPLDEQKLSGNKPKLMKSLGDLKQSGGNVLVKIFDKITDNQPHGVKQKAPKDDWKWDSEDDFSSDGNEEFFDTKEDNLKESKLTLVKEKISKMSLKENAQDAVGGLFQHYEFYLLNAPETPLMVPEVNDPGVTTQDMIDEQQKVFESLGTSDEAREIRAKMQSAQLVSDMQAFKAANPGAILFDFVRWHSPRDLVEGPDGQLGMSSRMTEEGNLWQNLWNSCQPMSARSQKPLFDPLQEGEKALHWLENYLIVDVLKSLLPVLILCIYDLLLPGSNSSSVPVPLSAFCFQAVKESFGKLGNLLSTLEWPTADESFSTDDVSTLQKAITRTELSVNTAISLELKFLNFKALQKTLMQIAFPDVKEDQSEYIVSSDQQVILSEKDKNILELLVFLMKLKSTELQQPETLETCMKYTKALTRWPEDLQSLRGHAAQKTFEALVQRIYIKAEAFKFKVFETHSKI